MIKMKKVAFSLLILLSITVSGQIYKGSVTFQTSTDYISWDVSKISDDTVYWMKFKDKNPFDITFDFTYFDDDDAILDVYRASIKGDSIYYNSIGNIYCVSFPVTLVRATYQNIYETDTISVIGIDADNWKGDLIGIYLDPGSVTAGSLIMITDK